MVDTSGESGPARTRKQRIMDHADRFARARRDWKARTGYFHALDERYMRFLVPEGARVLDLGCGPGDLLAALKPSVGVGVDLSAEMTAVAREAHPGLTFVAADVESPGFVASLDGAQFDYIVLSDTIGMLEDCQRTLAALEPLCHRDTRIVVAYFSPLHAPVLRLAERLGLKMRQPIHNNLSPTDIRHLMDLADFDVVKQERRILVPLRLLGLGELANRFFGFLPGVRRLCIRNYTVARSIAKAPMEARSVSVVVPCRNERGNIAGCVERTPDFGDGVEIIFVEGHSSDGTYEEIERVSAAYSGPKTIRYARQPGTGKGDAVRTGFQMAKGEVLMILDADLTISPEDLPKFYDALVAGKGELINGSRLVYPMERQAMRFLNIVANNLFSWIFSWLLNQRITDTLCGTKVLTRGSYAKIAGGRDYFGEFDPFGDFDLLFGAGKLNLKIIDLPVRYVARRYGETQISRFRHGWLLVRMVGVAYRKFAAFK